MKPTLQYTAIRTSKAFDDFLGALYMRAKRDAEEIVVPPLKVIAVRGNKPPASQQFQRAIAVLYGIGYGLKMGMKFGKLPRPAGYFDYKVGALGTFWASTHEAFDISDAASLRWQTDDGRARLRPRRRAGILALILTAAFAIAGGARWRGRRVRRVTG